MLIAVLVLQCVMLVVLVVLLLRKQAGGEVDPRLAQLPDAFARLDEHVRDGSAQMRREIQDEAVRTRTENAAAAGALREEVLGNITTLGSSLKAELAAFGEASSGAADKLRSDVEQKMRGISQSFTEFKNETTTKQDGLQRTLNDKLVELMASNAGHQEKLRTTVEGRLDALNATNAAKLEEMRVTVDEKLHATLQTRLTESFGQVTTHLGEVQKGLGEMKELATGVGDLKKVLSNVSRRGGVGEFLVGQQLEQMFSPEQYLKQVKIKQNSREAVDYALKFPSGDPGEYVLLPIDAKFLTSDWERLEQAYNQGSAEEIAAAGKAFEASIRSEAKSISEKYIDPPTTMPHAIMVLPTEGLYAELVRRPGLQAEMQANYRVTIAGPSTFMAILTSFQMGFHTLAIHKKGDEVWKVLSKAKNEFGKFGDLMDTMEKQVNTVQGTIQKLGTRTRAINRTLADVSETGTLPDNVLSFDGAVPQLAAGGDEE